MMCFWPPHLFSEWVLGCYYVTWYIYLDFVHFKIGAGIYIPLDAEQHESDWANRKYNNFTFSLTTPDLFVRVAPGYSFTLLLKYSYFCFIWSLDTDECWFGESLESKSIDIECMYWFTTYFDTLQSNIMQYCSKLNIQYSESDTCTRTFTANIFLTSWLRY